MTANEVEKLKSEHHAYRDNPDLSYLFNPAWVRAMTVVGEYHRQQEGDRNFFRRSIRWGGYTLWRLVWRPLPDKGDIIRESGGRVSLATDRIGEL